jgi:hypothetical protein
MTRRWWVPVIGECDPSFMNVVNACERQNEEEDEKEKAKTEKDED